MDEQEHEKTIALHFMGEPVRILGLFYAQCACGRFISEGCAVPSRAKKATCAFEEAEARAASTWRAFDRARRIEGGELSKRKSLLVGRG